MLAFILSPDYFTARARSSGPPPRGPETQRLLKELCEVFTHPIAKVWNHDLGWKVVKVMDTHLVS
jgi:hypothetical protein